MRPAASEAEATGQPFIVAAYRGHEFKLPTDADDWPLDVIAYSVGTRDGKLVAHHPAVARALRALLGDQWDGFLRAFPRRRDLVPASQVFAAAAGFDGTADDIAFGALPRILAAIERHAGAVEATLAELGVDYRDRFRYDAEHRRVLTLRQIYVRLHYAPLNNPLAVAQNNGRLQLTGTELLLMDLFEAITKSRHPSRPMSDEQKAARAAKNVNIDAEREKYRQRHAPRNRKQLAVATARANAQPKRGT